MDLGKVLIWSLIGGLAVLGAVLALFLGIDRPPPIDALAWDVAGAEPIVIGAAGDPFSYAGTHARALDGRAELRITPDGAGILDVRLQIAPGDPPIALLATGRRIERRIELHSALGPGVLLSRDIVLFGDTGIGRSPLPQTRAVLYAESRFQLTVDGERADGEWVGEWAIADALRRADGSIRQQGLVFSPLLRDKTGFSNPARSEWTLILRAPAGGATAAPVDLHVVFRTVEIIRRPDGD